jgi:hypothetical protein
MRRIETTVIETTVFVDDAHRATIEPPADVAPGTHRVLVLTIDEPAVREEPRAPLEFPHHDVGPWPEGFTVRREEIYGDDGR